MLKQLIPLIMYDVVLITVHHGMWNSLFDYYRLSLHLLGPQLIQTTCAPQKRPLNCPFRSLQKQKLRVPTIHSSSRAPNMLDPLQQSLPSGWDTSVCALVYSDFSSLSVALVSWITPCSSISNPAIYLFLLHAHIVSRECQFLLVGCFDTFHELIDAKLPNANLINDTETLLRFKSKHATLYTSIDGAL